MLHLGLLIALAGCGSGEVAPEPTGTRATETSASATESVRDVMDLPRFSPLEPGTYAIDPDDDPSTRLRVLYTVPAEGWSMWIGAAKFEAGAPGSGRHLGISITTVTNLVADPCHDHRPADPPVGPGVEDLADALADLPPFHVTSPPTDVTVGGYSGKHLALTVPDIPYELRGDRTHFTACANGYLRSWIAPALSFAYWGYSGPRHVEEFRILDVEGSRLVIQTNWSADSPPQDHAELRAILDSIAIEP